MAMLQVVHPLALVARPIDMDVDTLPIGLVIDPIPLIDITVDVSELTETMRAVIFPVTLIHCAI